MKQLLLAVLTLGLVSTVLAGPTEVPKGSALRAELFDLARSGVESEAGQTVKFNGSLKRLGDWAFFVGQIVDASGKQIRVGPNESADTALLWKIVDSEWQSITYVVGMTDVAYASWPDEFGAPQELIFPEG
jgi:hypothetical protein